MNSVVCGLLVAIAASSMLCSAYPYRGGSNYELIPLRDLQEEESSIYPQAVLPVQDLEGAATEHGHYGRVQIKVYRGPSTHHGHEHFAPHGFWVKQPADDHHH